MTIITVNASSSYSIWIGNGALSRLSERVAEVTAGNHICVVSDSNVFPLYGQQVCDHLRSNGYEVCCFTFHAGENSKNIHTYAALMDFLAENLLGRKDCIIALGGGVVGDLAGFAAATYLRGIPYIQIPSSLLAMVDSSVGGKTAIDLPAGKNLCGAFYQPAAVLCDPEMLCSLPEEVFLDGCAEIIKYGILFDHDLLAHLEQTGTAFDREVVISRCIRLKRDVVELDEFESGKRMLLNLGHTFGHAIEKCSDYSISHGKAVSIGMAMVSRAVKCPDTERILTLLRQFCLPTVTEYSADALLEAAMADKKRHDSTISLIIPKAIGDCEIVPTPLNSLKTFIEEGM